MSTGTCSYSYFNTGIIEQQGSWQASEKLLIAGVDPGFEIGGGGDARNAHVSTRPVPHSLSSPQPGLGTLDLAPFSN